VGVTGHPGQERLIFGLGILQVLLLCRYRRSHRSRYRHRGRGQRGRKERGSSLRIPFLNYRCSARTDTKEEGDKEEEVRKKKKIIELDKC
jgi:hypothetical protein